MNKREKALVESLEKTFLHYRAKRDKVEKILCREIGADYICFQEHYESGLHLNVNINGRYEPTQTYKELINNMGIE